MIGVSSYLGRVCTSLTTRPCPQLLYTLEASGHLDSGTNAHDPGPLPGRAGSRASVPGEPRPASPQLPCWPTAALPQREQGKRGQVPLLLQRRQLLPLDGREGPGEADARFMRQNRPWGARQALPRSGAHSQASCPQAAPSRPPAAPEL